MLQEWRFSYCRFIYFIYLLYMLDYKLVYDKPSKETFEKCLADLIIEKNKILLNKHEEQLIEYIDKVIESIQVYLSIVDFESQIEEE